MRTIATRAEENRSEGDGREPVLPPREQAPKLIPPKGGVTWRIAGDFRLFSASAYALLLQVMHPSVGAGVSQYSNFKEDPWGRLLRTLDYTSSAIFGGPDLAWTVGRRVREMHKDIKGIRPDGERYHALEPGPYAWVHATLAEAIIKAHRLFCSPRISDAEIDVFWEEWRRMGRLIGVRYRDLPETWSGLLDYFDRMVEEELESTEAAQDVLATLFDPSAPPIPWMRDGLWKAMTWPVSKVDTLGIEWDANKERRFRVVARVARASRPLMPPQARNFGPHYLKWRRKQIERGDVASGRGRKPVPA